jgi:uncharacterized protein with HEPN domain
VKDVSVYLIHMLDSMDRVAEYIEAGEEHFSSSPMVQDAVIRNLEVIGEAAKRVPDDIREQSQTIPWKRLAGLRDILIHQYDGVDLQQVWRVAQVVLPPIATDLRVMLDPSQDNQ